LTSSEQFPNHYFSASSSYGDTRLAHLSRLDSKTSWSSFKTNNPNDYLQVDLGLDYQICAVGTKGSNAHSEWTTEYKLAYSLDNKHWMNYREKGIVKVFDLCKEYITTARVYIL
jgi:hypothetical protein